MTVELHVTIQCFDELVHSCEVQGTAVAHDGIVLHGIARSKNLIVGIGKAAFSIGIVDIQVCTHADTNQHVRSILLGIVLDVVVVGDDFLHGKRNLC